MDLSIIYLFYAKVYIFGSSVSKQKVSYQISTLGWSFAFLELLFSLCFP